MRRAVLLFTLLGCAPAKEPATKTIAAAPAPTPSPSPVVSASAEPAPSIAPSSNKPAEPEPIEPSDGLSAAEIKSVIDPVRPQIKKCDDGSGGKIVVAAKIDKKGHALIAIESSTATHPVTTCVVKLVEKLQFPQSKNGAMIRFPITFSK